MPIARAWERLISGHAARSLAGVFRTAYGRAPRPEERATLAAIDPPPRTPASAFRAVVGAFDRQSLNTPFAVRLTPEDVSYIDFHGVSIAVDLADGSVSRPLRSGEYEPHIVAFLKQRLQPGMTFVDIGANLGSLAILAAKLVGETGRVFCFEPNSENCRLILLSTTRNDLKNITLFPVAASSTPGHALFGTHMGSNGGLMPSSTDVLLNPGCLVVPTFRLDDLIHDRIDFLKIDTEGAEGLVIGGAGRLLQQHRPIVVTEFSPEMLGRVSRIAASDYLQRFRDLQYRIHVIDRQTRALTPIPDPDAFLRDYGPSTRIEDLAFLPG